MTLSVTSTNDSGTGSLRAVLSQANHGDTINFAIPLPGAITLTSAELVVAKNITISGPGASYLTIRRSAAASVPAFRIFRIPPNITATITGLTLSNGKTTDYAQHFPDDGAGILNRGVLHLVNCVISGGNADAFGGAIHNFGILTMEGSTLFNNRAGISANGYGGGIENAGGAVSITNSTISNNRANNSGAGGGIRNGSHMNISNTTISGNTAGGVAGEGAGIENFSMLNLTNCTITKNELDLGTAGAGGGIDNNGSATIRIINCTITANSDGGFATGGGIYNDLNGNGATATIKNTIIAGNSGATSPDVGGPFISQGFNVIGKSDGSTGFTMTSDHTGTAAAPIDPLLDPAGLRSNGGLAKTIALRGNSIAVNHGTTSGAPARDQRNYIRTGLPDIGAFEFGGTIPVTLGNISTRGLVGTGDNVLIGGFVITGTHNKRVLLRALGPSLNVVGKLTNPTLQLFKGQTLLATNDNWSSASNHQDILNTALQPPNPAESAILTTLAPGGYTAIVRGVSNTNGIALVDGYDLDRTTDSKFINISTRGLVGTNDNIMIGGFAVLGSDSQKVIIRAVGPSLSLVGKLANPTLELRTPQGVLITSNDNWRTTQQAEIIASGFMPANDLEPAIVRTFTPGNYMALVRGVNSTTGLALVEVYSLN
ncbi:MAG TPA: right-handed parallel beta-helix repeat-containing protein [Candidatus Udaeobacter sp.]|nr:right-handed parallel beta-helix repeat-containing protein [Candidatus Udaeobacter sp.]